MGFVRVADVAARAGVSSGTVSNFFHNPARVAASTAERIRAAIDDLGYVPNDAARALRRRETKTIGHLAFEVANPYSAAFVHAVDREARTLGYTVLNVSSEGDPRLQRELLDLFARQRVDGVLLSPVGEATEAAERLAAHGIPLVLTDSVEDSASSVSYDDFLGGRLAASHLLELGHRRIAFIGYNAEIGIIARRLQGAQEEIEKVPGARLSVKSLKTRSIASGRRVGERLAAMDASERPTGLIAVNDLVSVGVLNGVFGQLRVPEDLAIVGFDDIEFAAEAVIPLTSVQRPVEAFAERAVALLHERIQNRDQAEAIFALNLAPRLVVRASTVGSR